MSKGKVLVDVEMLTEALAYIKLYQAEIGRCVSTEGPTKIQTLIDDLEAATAQKLAQPWIQWDGGEEPPVPNGTAVNVRYRSGEYAFGCTVGADGQGAVVWEHEGVDLDIVEWQKIEV